MNNSVRNLAATLCIGTLSVTAGACKSKAAQTTPVPAAKGAEAKCGAGKCGGGQCGTKPAAPATDGSGAPTAGSPAPTTTTTTKGAEGKCGANSCG